MQLPGMGKAQYPQRQSQTKLLLRLGNMSIDLPSISDIAPGPMKLRKVLLQLLRHPCHRQFCK